LKRGLLFDVDPQLFPHVVGSTDSETLFFLALTFGLRSEPLDELADHWDAVPESAFVTVESGEATIHRFAPH